MRDSTLANECASYFCYLSHLLFLYIKWIAVPLSHSVLQLIDSLLKTSGFPSKASGKDKITYLFALTLSPFVVGWQTLDCGSQVNSQFPDSFLEWLFVKLLLLKLPLIARLRFVQFTSFFEERWRAKFRTSSVLQPLEFSTSFSGPRERTLGTTEISSYTFSNGNKSRN